MNPAEAFAAHVLGLKWCDLPPSAQAAMKAFLLDTLCVGVAGRRAWLADEVLGVAQSWGDAGQGPAAHVFGGGPRLPQASAAFVNGFQIHCQEYDCVHEAAVVHPMAVIGAALTSEAEARAVPGADYLAALVGAVDVAAGLGVATKSAIRFFRPATAGLFGATLGIARMRGAGLGQAMDALGYALAQAAGTMQAHVEGKPALPLQIAGAARAAVVANDLAEAGVPGPHDVLEGPYGYLSLFELETDLAPVLDSLGAIWRVEEVSYKPFPTGRAAQGGIVLMRQLREAGAAPDQIETLTLTAPPLIQRLVGRPATDDMTVNYARLCFAYLGACALRFGPVGLKHFTPQALGDRDTLALAAKIRVQTDGSEDPAAFTPQTIEATLADGRVLHQSIGAIYGSPAAPMTPPDLAAKRGECLAFGFGVDRPDLEAALIGEIDALENAPSAARAAWLASGLEAP